jgi:IclR family transcriptional regulator, KDG regulon repressor
VAKRTKDSRYSSLSPAVEQATEILRYLASKPHMKVGITDIAKVVGIHKSKTQSILKALQIGGFVSRNEENKTYCLGIGLIPVGQRALDNLDYGRIAKPFLEKLARETKCTVLLGLITAQNLLVVAKEESGMEVDSVVGIGYTNKIFYRSHGKAILASLPKEEQERLLSGDNFFDGGRVGIIDNPKLAKELKKIRKKGFATDEGWATPAVKLLAATIVGFNKHPIGAIIIIGLIKTLAVPRVGAKLVEAARKLSSTFGMRDREDTRVSLL